MWYGLDCMGLGYRFGQSIVEAAKTPGSFYTTGSSKTLLIVPSLKIAVLRTRTNALAKISVRHLVDIPTEPLNVRFWGKADMPVCTANVGL